MSLRTALTVATAGTVLTTTAADVAGDTFANTGKEFLLVENGGGSSVTVTVATPATTDGLAIADLAVAVAAGASKMIGPFNKSLYNDANGIASVTYSAVTDVTIAVVAFKALAG